MSRLAASLGVFRRRLLYRLQHLQRQDTNDRRSSDGICNRSRKCVVRILSNPRLKLIEMGTTVTVVKVQPLLLLGLKKWMLWWWKAPI